MGFSHHIPTIPDTNAVPATTKTRINFSPEPFPRFTFLCSCGNSGVNAPSLGLSSNGGRSGTSFMSMISRREGFLGLLLSEGFVACIGLPQFQQNAYLSSMADPQCWQTPPSDLGVATVAGALGGASVAISLGWISAGAQI